MNETRKMSEIRKSRGDYDAYLIGKGIDIGCGSDPLVIEHGSVMPWDKAQGDAQKLAGVSDDSFDFVYSSHCLEHLVDPIDGLRNWIRVVRPGGHLYVTIPDYLRYEGCHWPSRKNRDHKSTWSTELTRKQVGRHNHWHIDNDLRPCIEAMGATLCRVLVEDDGYNYNMGLEKDQTLGNAAAQINLLIRKD